MLTNFHNQIPITKYAAKDNKYSISIISHHLCSHKLIQSLVSSLRSLHGHAVRVSINTRTNYAAISIKQN